MGTQVFFHHSIVDLFGFLGTRPSSPNQMIEFKVVNKESQKKRRDYTVQKNPEAPASRKGRSDLVQNHSICLFT